MVGKWSVIHIVYVSMELHLYVKIKISTGLSAFSKLSGLDRDDKPANKRGGDELEEKPLAEAKSIP